MMPPSSPQTPRHSPYPSMENLRSAASYSPQEGRALSHKSSFNDPLTPSRNSFNSSVGPTMDIGMFGNGGMDNGGGLGNLADELADAFSDGEDDYFEGQEGEETRNMDSKGEEEDLLPTPMPKDGGGIRDSGVDVASPRSRQRASLKSQLSPNGRGHHHHHRRKGSEYDGSEYGSESDLEPSGLSPRLVEKMAEVESLARRGTESNGSAADGAFQRVTEGLRDLGSQAGVEGGATRLITAHSALTTHLTHQTRQLHSLTFPLLSPLSPAPDAEAIDELLPMLVSLSSCMPRPSTAAFAQLASLHTITTDLVHTLNYLSDTLHMSRQTTTTATRRLKSARELVAELKREEELREQGERWLSRGNWSERLRNRECAHVCGEVVGGFEEVCNTWRKRLLAQEGGGGGGAGEGPGTAGSVEA
ncbi:hypothetical protein GE21DRAFT_7696 [Neurospora crassa]|uniref:Uncharacterized protein n=2 Tax=Neurospora crassa TaxID=5141 RepID=Q7S7B5_NEUCR|nr:hypothetical protein NCU01277 [Neurospora crassa OR74A]EAA31519.2 hypothetical protein NCU01277 [Neurospora crassa OR74A]KHE82534.1 hypothetical protein GE21DRAFT_7696 [Neurospora crassa]|eukprot:XP_960755.2 hypothetical protein NCU01277 [Neurospora crassa OR74A]